MIEAAEAEGAIEAGPGDPRADLRQHRHRAGDDLPPQGLPAEGGDARQRHRGAHRAAARCTGRRSSTRRARRARTARSRWRWRWPRTPASTCPTSTATRPIRVPTTTAPRSRSSTSSTRSTAFVAGLGTGGTLMGNGRRLKEANPETLIVAAEPKQGELVQGLRSLDDGFIPPIIDLSLLDRKIMVSNRDAIVWTKSCSTRRASSPGSPPGRSPTSPPHSRRTRRRQRRLRHPRRRLEVPVLGRLHQADRGDRGARLHRLVVGRPRVGPMRISRP